MILEDEHVVQEEASCRYRLGTGDRGDPRRRSGVRVGRF